jgi:hypothetical protein
VIDWKFVPIEPTPEMIEAAKDNRASQPPGTLPGSAMRQMFEAMIAAAPSSELVKAAEDAILILRCLSVDENLSENWRDKADRAANELMTAVDKQ